MAFALLLARWCPSTMPTWNVKLISWPHSCDNSRAFSRILCGITRPTGRVELTKLVNTNCFGVHRHPRERHARVKVAMSVELIYNTVQGCCRCRAWSYVTRESAWRRLQRVNWIIPINFSKLRARTRIRDRGGEPYFYFLYGALNRYFSEKRLCIYFVHIEFLYPLIIL